MQDVIWRDRRINHVFLLLSALLLLAFSVISLTGFPSFYEDESWVFLPSFEFLRGNGFSMEALGDRAPNLFLSFNIFTLMFSSIIPTRPEYAIRIASIVLMMVIMVASWATVARLNPRMAWLAPVVLVSVPLSFISLRYGRPETFADALSMSALACAAWKRFRMSGLLAGLAVSVHPVQMWVGLPCAMLAFQSGSWRYVGRFAVGGIVGILPQAGWTLAHLHDLPTITKRYFITSSLSSGRFAMLDSLLLEKDRYVSYVASLGWFDRAVQIVFFVALPLASLFKRSSFERALLLAIWLGPCVALALFSQGKNYYYFVSAIPAWTVVAAAGASALPRGLVASLALVSLAIVAVRNVGNLEAGRTAPQVADIVDSLSAELPPGAAVFSTLRYAGLVRLRPDLRFYAYHALSTRSDGWTYPHCNHIKQRLRDILAEGRRPSSIHAPHPQPHSVSFVSVDTWPLINYLRQIYNPVSPEDVACLLDEAKSKTVTKTFCDKLNAQCISLSLTTLPLTPQ